MVFHIFLSVCKYNTLRRQILLFIKDYSQKNVNMNANLAEMQHLSEEKYTQIPTLYTNKLQCFITLQNGLYCFKLHAFVHLKLKLFREQTSSWYKNLKKTMNQKKSKENKNTLHSFEEKNTYNPHIPFQYCGLFFFFFRIYNDM